MIRRQWILRFLLGWSYSHDPASAPRYRMIYDPLELCAPCTLGLLLPHGRPQCRSIYAVFPAWRQGIPRGVGKVSGYCCYKARSRVKAWSSAHRRHDSLVSSYYPSWLPARAPHSVHLVVSPYIRVRKPCGASMEGGKSDQGCPIYTGQSSHCSRANLVSFPIPYLSLLCIIERTK